MASPSDLQPGSANTTVTPDGSSIAMNSSSGSVTNGTVPYLYHHPHHHGGGINLAGVLVGILLPHAVCTLFVLARAWSRGVILRKWFLDDSLVVAAWLCSTAVCVVYSMSAVQTGGHRSSSSGSVSTEDSSTSALTAYLLRTYLGLIFYQLCLCLTKLSILALYLRMFAAVVASASSSSNNNNNNNNSSSTTLRRRHLRERRLAWLTVVVVVAYGVPLLWMSIMQCYPAASSSSSTAAGSQFFGRPVAVCFSFTPLLVASASLHTATDAWLIVLVVPFVLTRLRFLPRSQRWALAAVLSLSVFVIAASLTRLQLSLHANYRPGSMDPRISPQSSQLQQRQQQQGPDRANILGFFVMTILECDIALICASAPTLRPLLARLAPRLGLGDDLDPTGGRRRGGYYRRDSSGRLHYRRSLFRPRAPPADDDGDSVDLTSVVSYHGYPWTRAGTPERGRSKSDVGRGVDAHAVSVPLNESSSSHATAVAVDDERNKHGEHGEPAPPLPAFHKPLGAPHRTPTERSLRSLPRSRGGGHNTTATAAAGSPMDDGSLPSGALTRRPSSVFFENSDYDQYFRTPEQQQQQQQHGGGDAKSAANTPGGGTKKAGVPGAGIGLGILLLPINNSSQESFVMGLNDPASPTRPMRLTGVSGYSGETFTGEEEEGADGEDGKYGEDEAEAKKRKNVETSFLDDETDNEEEESPATKDDHGGHPLHDKTGDKDGF